jgi:hypothetical protein
MQYYFYIDQNPQSPTYEKPRNVARVDKQATPIVEQSWTGKDWQDNPDLIRSISGIGGDGSQWQETTEAEAKKFIEAQFGCKPVLVFAKPADKSLQGFYSRHCQESQPGCQKRHDRGRLGKRLAGVLERLCQ